MGNSRGGRDGVPALSPRLLDGGQKGKGRCTDSRAQQREAVLHRDGICDDGLQEASVVHWVQSKTERSEWGQELDPQVPHVSTHSPPRWMTTEAMMAWLEFLRSPPEYRGGHALDVIRDGYAIHVCDDVKALADELGIELDFIPPGLTDLLQPPDRSVFGGHKAEHRAVYRKAMSQREDQRIAKIDFAAYLIPAR